jgi:hypothetical protein
MPSLAVGLTPVHFLGSNTGRQTMTVRNASTGTQKIYFWAHGPDGLTTGNADYVLNLSEEKSFVLFFDGRDVQQDWSAVADVAGGQIYFAETLTGG